MSEYNPLEEALKLEPPNIPMNKFQNSSQVRRFQKYQPERLNPEDHIRDDTKMVCDSLNTANK